MNFQRYLQAGSDKVGEFVVFGRVDREHHSSAVAGCHVGQVGDGDRVEAIVHVSRLQGAKLGVNY